MKSHSDDRFVVISGCSGGGKSTLLAELSRRGHSVVEEPGRRIVARELECGGSALPWIDPAAFAKEAVKLAQADREAARGLAGLIFFDRGLVDAAAALQHFTGEPHLDRLGHHRYHARVFLAPPWPVIYVIDESRRHSLEDAVAEYDRLRAAYTSLGYRLEVLSKASVRKRADLILDSLRRR